MSALEGPGAFVIGRCGPHLGGQFVDAVHRGRQRGAVLLPPRALLHQRRVALRDQFAQGRHVALQGVAVAVRGVQLLGEGDGAVALAVAVVLQAALALGEVFPVDQQVVHGALRWHGRGGR